MARQAGKAAPAMAVVGALAAAPTLHRLDSPPAAATAAQHRPVTAQAATEELGGDQAGANQADRASAASVRTRAASSAASAASATSSFKIMSYRNVQQRASVAPHHISHPVNPSHPSPAPTTGSGGGKHRKPAPAPAPAPGTVTCSPDATGMVPENYAAIVEFLTANGYTGVGAAGIAGNIYQESKGDPESAGGDAGGLIGWTPLPAGLVTGNPEADLQSQLAAILTFNDQFAADIPLLNDASSPAAAADVYVTDFEHAGIPAESTREAAAEAVAQACGI